MIRMSNALRVTLDTNSIIDLERNRPDAIFIKALLVGHDGDEPHLRVPAIIASENPLEGRFPENFSDFQGLLKRVGLDRAEILAPIAYYGITYYGYSVYPSDEMVRLEKTIHEVLFPNIEFDFETYRSRLNLPRDGLDRRWRNA